MKWPDWKVGLNTGLGKNKVKLNEFLLDPTIVYPFKILFGLSQMEL